MQIKPSLFTPSAPPTPSAGNASEARRAFEAMLSASAARTKSTQAPAAVQDGTLAPLMRPAVRAQAEPISVNQDLPSRPGRVLDIKV
jgi:hypothetical protein